ncbi:MAG: tail fiber domain-containing protein, partial [Ignavibacteria bacterium]|nr:tail fiber domain-containing protein [Ignavibacteria bacterium]
KLKPRLYNWDKREWYEGNVSDGSKMQEAPTAGFIAQELDEIQTNENAEWLNLVLKDNPEKWEATPGNLLPVMVKAIQELSVKCEELKMKNDQLNKQLEEMNNMKQSVAELKAAIEELKVKSNLVDEKNAHTKTVSNSNNE